MADLSGRHEGRVFCVGFDCTKIVSCGEDQVCILLLLILFCVLTTGAS